MNDITLADADKLDELAAIALQGLLAGGWSGHPSTAASSAYQHAACMLYERAKWRALLAERAAGCDVQTQKA
jgi:hypothetical protein